jgi:hypothetical protein
MDNMKSENNGNNNGDAQPNPAADHTNFAKAVTLAIPLSNGGKLLPESHLLPGRILVSYFGNW